MPNSLPTVKLTTSLAQAGAPGLHGIGNAIATDGHISFGTGTSIATGCSPIILLLVPHPVMIRQC